MTVVDELGSLPDRIAACSEHVRDLQAQLKNAVAARDQLIVEAIDHAGMKHREAAKAAQLSSTQIVRVLAGSSAD